MRILMATYWYLPHVGGVNTYVNVLRKELLKQGHQVDVLAHDTERNENIYLLNSGKYIKKDKVKDLVYKKVYDYYERYQPYVEPWVRWREIERYTYELCASLFNLDQYDLIHTQDIISTRAISRVKPVGVAHVATIHGLLATEHIIAGDITSKKSLPWAYVCAEEYYGATSADQTILPTHWLKKMLMRKSFGVPDDRLTVIPYGMEVANFLAKAKSPTYEYIPFTEPNKTILICPARLVPVKGHRYLLEALAKLKQKRNDFVCWLVGGGDLYYELVALSHQLNIHDVVHFLGDRKDVPQLISHSHIVVLPSVQDNHPFTVMEAQVAGKLIVASQTGGIPEMIEDQKTGILFPNRDSDQLAEKLDLVISDPELRNRIAANGRKWGVQRWSPTTLLNNTMEIYRKALHSAKKGEYNEHLSQEENLKN